MQSGYRGDDRLCSVLSPRLDGRSAFVGSGTVIINRVERTVLGYTYVPTSSAPKDIAALVNGWKDLLKALFVLGGAGWEYTDFKKENVVWSGERAVLVDFEDMKFEPLAAASKNANGAARVMREFITESPTLRAHANSVLEVLARPSWHDADELFEALSEVGSGVGASPTKAAPVTPPPSPKIAADSPAADSSGTQPSSARETPAISTGSTAPATADTRPVSQPSAASQPTSSLTTWRVLGVLLVVVLAVGVWDYFVRREPGPGPGHPMVDSPDSRPLTDAEVEVQVPASPPPSDSHRLADGTCLPRRCETATASQLSAPDSSTFGRLCQPPSRLPTASEVQADGIVRECVHDRSTHELVDDGQNVVMENGISLETSVHFDTFQYVFRCTEPCR